MPSLATLLVSTLFVANSVLGFNYTIGVGKDEVTGLPGVGFDPSRTVVAETGDLVIFSFLQGEHQVYQTIFSAPCSPGGEFTTPLLNVSNGTVSGGPSFSYEVTSLSTPLYFYDAAGVNCQQGAVFCVNTNENLANQSCSAFKAAALAIGASEGVTTSVRTASAAVPTNSSSTITSSPTATANAVTTSSASAASTTSKTGGAGRTVSGVVSGVVAGVLGVVGIAVML
ncbi:hypothetical protein MNV49_005570 [Pseudohyphozyma bogoriensis]|nr:hypothetical protein MNV49_005570 [Pseudohyphozyma bogoriensis]